MRARVRNSGDPFATRISRVAVGTRAASCALAIIGCNAILGIESAERTCEPCAAGQSCEEGTCIDALRPAIDDGAGAPGSALDAEIAVGVQKCDHPGETYCLGGRRVACGLDGLVTSSTQCASQAHCEQAAGGQDCATCIPTCQGSRLSACQDGVSIAEQDCGTNFCDTKQGGGCLMAACTAGQSDCAGQQFLRCTDGMSFTVAEVCATAALCTSEGCHPPACEVAEKRCAGTALSICREDRTGFVTLEQCATAALCDQAAGVCRPPVCALEDASCDAATLRKCNEDRTGFVEQACESQSLCDGAAGVCQLPACEVGAGRCEGNVLFRCDGEPPRFGRLDACDSATLCDAAGVQCLACVPNSRRCSDDGRAQITCDASGQTESLQVCPMLLGLLGRCLDGVCVAL
jgi:hypothetical protein